jgi:hypothetical protein
MMTTADLVFVVSHSFARKKAEEWETILLLHREERPQILRFLRCAPVAQDDSIYEANFLSGS